jgi:uncharacterized protein (DUF885 family)
MKTKTVLLLCASAMISWNTYASKNHQRNIDSTADERLETMFNNYWEERLKLYPLDATEEGDTRYNDQLPNNQTQSYRDSLKAFYQSYSDTIKTFDRSKLSERDRISYDIFLYEMNRQLDGLTLNAWMLPNDDFFISFALSGSGNSSQPFKTAGDYDNWLARMNKFPVIADSAIGNYRQGMATGVVWPKALVVKLIPELQAMIVSDPIKSLFYTPVTHLPKDISASDSERLTTAYKQAIVAEIIPTYKKLADFFKIEYLPKTRSTAGLSAIPGGKEMYDYDVRYWTTTNETPEQIYETGLQQVALVTRLIDSVKDVVGFKGDLKALFHYMNTDKRFFPFTTPRQVLDSFEAIHKIVDAHVKNLFGVFPKASFEIRQVEKFREKTTGVPEYFPGSSDGSRPGIFYVPVPDATKFNANQMEDHFLHEAIPGHHYQISLQQEDAALPKFRRFGQYNAYTEGYAFYCESLGKELGVYKDPYQYLASLQGEMHRAIRLVVDVAIHTKGMTREEAIKYMMDHEPVTEYVATAEIERYMRRPAQALSYMTGRLKILELRNKYEKELGNKFNLIAFHDKILSGGSMPLKVLQEETDEWAKKRATAGD